MENQHKHNYMGFVKSFTFHFFKVTQPLKTLFLEIPSYFSKSVVVLSAIGSLAAAIGTFSTIYYINKQNKLSIQPQLLIHEEEMFFCATRNFKTQEVYFFCCNQDSLKYDNSEDFDIDTAYNIPSELLNAYKFHIANVGLGSAKNIKIEFTCDTSEYFNKVKNNILNIAKDTSIIKWFKNFLFALSSYKPSSETHLLLLPYSLSKDMITGTLPYNYLQIYACNRMIYFEKKYFSLPDSVTAPILKVTIKYYDIANNEYIDKYVVGLKHDLGLVHGSNYEVNIETVQFVKVNK